MFSSVYTSWSKLWQTGNSALFLHHVLYNYIIGDSVTVLGMNGAFIESIVLIGEQKINKHAKTYSIFGKQKIGL